MTPGQPYEYNGEEWEVSLVTSTHFTIERNGKWRCLERKDV